ncbi:beta-1,3-galactosyltransferase 5-like [Saccoglossus kowalevskii]|uniref:Hexosyltransferase n=1 Tax=Saccoglossus kowalevskii TaxID=10224 RepID=A0ABM0GV51_SACKO|nr:PREDICTED: probable beta-1,3-galactosyltransferase 18-like [Saccoglossus kowalevskii]
MLWFFVPRHLRKVYILYSFVFAGAVFLYLQTSQSRLVQRYSLCLKRSCVYVGNATRGEVTKKAPFSSNVTYFDGGQHRHELSTRNNRTAKESELRGDGVPIYYDGELPTWGKSAGVAPALPEDAFYYHNEYDSQWNTEKQNSTVNHHIPIDNKTGNKTLPVYSNTTKINPHQYHFIIDNKDACDNFGPNVFLLILVFNTHKEQENRKAIRRYWGGKRIIHGYKTMTMFLLGTTNSTRMQREIEFENSIYNDIVQEDFVDSYNNLTLKTIMGLRWASLFCPTAKYIMKADGRDIFVVRENVVDRLSKQPVQTGFAEGNRLSREKPIRMLNSKWYTPEDLYPESTYPPYLEGPAYVMSSDVAKQAYVASQFVRYIPWEDVFFGLVLKKIGVKPRQGWYYDVAWYSVYHDTGNPCHIKEANTVKFGAYSLHKHGYAVQCRTIRRLIDTDASKC